MSERFFIEKISSFHPEFFKVRMFLNFYRKNLWFHNYFMILHFTVVLTEKTCVIARFFLLFSLVFLLKAKVDCSDFFVFAIIIIVF